SQLRAMGNHDIGVVALKRIAARDRNCSCNHKHSRAGNVPGVDRLLDADVTVTCAFGFQVTQCGEAFFQRATSRHRRPRRAESDRVFQELNVISSFCRVLALKKDVGMGINQPWQNCHVGSKVDDRSSCGRSSTLPYALNLVPCNDDTDVVPQLACSAVNQVGGMDYNRLPGRGLSLLAE